MNLFLFKSGLWIAALVSMGVAAVHIELIQLPKANQVAGWMIHQAWKQMTRRPPETTEAPPCDPYEELGGQC